MELGSALRLDVDTVPVEAAQEYEIAGVFSFGRGLFPRGPITGAETSYRKLNRLHTGQLVLSRLKAFEGAVAVVPEEFDGWFLSPEFPTFRCVDGMLDSEYLMHLCRWPDFWSAMAGTSRGIGARRERVHATDLFGLRMELPALPEQRRIAAELSRFSEVAGRLAGLTASATTLDDALRVSLVSRPDLDDSAKYAAGWRRVKLGELMTPSNAQVEVEPANRYLVAGVYSFGRGLIDRGSIDGTETSYKTMTQLSAGDVVVSKLNGWEGAIAVVDQAFDYYHVSSEYPTFKPVHDELLPAFFAGIARAPRFWEELNASARGSMVRRRRINPAQFLDVEIWLPPMEIQRRVGSQLQLLRWLAVVREDAIARLDALLPAALNQSFAGLS